MEFEFEPLSLSELSKSLPLSALAVVVNSPGRRRPRPPRRRRLRFRGSESSLLTSVATTAGFSTATFATFATFFAGAAVAGAA
ncbi:unannotated protein [freshwater metagenome]|uniref:Unannotated protein n=1 Tax=freshwater metagenome TaxID=449393 RepID=A0A6J6WVK5_9ZZZZ